MVIYDQGLQKIAEELSDLIDQGQWGLGTAVPTSSDTGLESPITATQLSTTNTESGNSFQLTYELNTTTGNGNDLTEYEVQFSSDDTGLGRNLKGPISKTDDIKVTVISTYNILRG